LTGLKAASVPVRVLAATFAISTNSSVEIQKPGV